MVRDNEVKLSLSNLGVHCQSFNADLLREPWEVLDSAGKPYTCYDAFWAAHGAMPFPPPQPVPLPESLPTVNSSFVGIKIEELGIMTPEEELSNVQLEYHWKPGSEGAHKTLRSFLDNRLIMFDRDRAKTDRNSTSRLSPHVHFGEISARHIFQECIKKGAEWETENKGGSSVADFLRQLGYREYSRYLSFHFPFTHERSLLEHLRGVPWRFDQRLFKAWRQGRTGYPLIDAGMRELWSTGWMHNRLRVLAASFMVKHLLLPWQWGLKHYWDALLDADLECDALGWQYCAGCLSDANPFDELMDVNAESSRFDPDGNYVRRWLPVLARLPSKYIHRPWEAPESVLDDAGVELGINYPVPVVSMEEAEGVLAAAAASIGAAGNTRDIEKGPFMPATDVNPAAVSKFWSSQGGAAAALRIYKEGYTAGAAATENGLLYNGVGCRGDNINNGYNNNNNHASHRSSGPTSEEVVSNAAFLDDSGSMLVGGHPSSFIGGRSVNVNGFNTNGEYNTAATTTQGEGNSQERVLHQQHVLYDANPPSEEPMAVENSSIDAVAAGRHHHRVVIEQDTVMDASASGERCQQGVSGGNTGTNNGSGHATQTMNRGGFIYPAGTVVTDRGVIIDHDGGLPSVDEGGSGGGGDDREKQQQVNEEGSNREEQEWPKHKRPRPE